MPVPAVAAIPLPLVQHPPGTDTCVHNDDYSVNFSQDLDLIRKFFMKEQGPGPISVFRNYQRRVVQASDFEQVDLFDALPR